MSRLRLYKEVTLDTMVALEGSFANADATDSIDGIAGGTDTEELWAASEQTTLAAELSATSLRPVLTSARFAGSSYLLLRCEDELMLVTSKGGTTTPRVERGYASSTAAVHAVGTRIYSAYDYSRAWITETETGDADTDYVVEYSLDNVTFASTIGLGTFTYDDSVKLYRKVTVAADTPAALKIDIVHRLSAGIDPVEVA